MIRRIRKAFAFFSALIPAIAIGAIAGCANVPQKDREVLAEPCLQRIPDALENDLENHNLPRREGSAGGGSGSGGGCGC